METDTVFEGVFHQGTNACIKLIMSFICKFKVCKSSGVEVGRCNRVNCLNKLSTLLSHANSNFESIICIPTKDDSHILSAQLISCLLICLLNKFSVRGFPQDRGQGPLWVLTSRGRDPVAVLHFDWKSVKLVLLTLLSMNPKYKES